MLAIPVIDLQIQLLGAEGYDKETGFSGVTYLGNIGDVQRIRATKEAPYQLQITIPADPWLQNQLYQNLVNLRETTELANSQLMEVAKEMERELYDASADRAVSLVNEMGVQVIKERAEHGMIVLSTSLKSEDAERLQNMLQELLAAGVTKSGQYTKGAWVAVMPVTPALGAMTASVPAPHTITMRFQNMHGECEDQNMSLGEHLEVLEVAGFIDAAEEALRKNPAHYKISRRR